MKLTELFPSNLLKAQDVTDAGGEVPLKILNVEVKEFDGDKGKERKPILIFADEKRMVLNKTNANALGKMYGDDTDAWLGKEIILIVQDVDFQGSSVHAIRIKNLNNQDMLIQEFWNKSRALGFTREEGLKHLAQFGQDFKLALGALEGNPFGA